MFFAFSQQLRVNKKSDLTCLLAIIFFSQKRKNIVNGCIFSKDNVKIYKKDFVYLLESIEIDERF